MWVKQCHKRTIPQENHHFQKGGINLPCPGKWVVKMALFYPVCQNPGTPVVHIKIAGLKWMFIPLKMYTSIGIDPYPHVYPLVICYIAIENDPVEIVDFPIFLAWWIFPVRYVNHITLW